MKSFVGYFDQMFGYYKKLEDALKAKKTPGVCPRFFNFWFHRQLCAKMRDPKEKGMGTYRYRLPIHSPEEEIVMNFRWLAVEGPDQIANVREEDMKPFEMTISRGASRKCSATIRNLSTGESLLVVNEDNLLFPELDAFLTTHLVIATVGIQRGTALRIRRISDVTVTLPLEKPLLGGMEQARAMGLIK